MCIRDRYDAEIIDRVNKPCDDYSILATLKADGSIEKTVIGSVLQSYVLDPERKEEFGQMCIRDRGLI